MAVAVTMRTPGSEAELAVGFLRTEGLIGDDDVGCVEFGDAAALAQPDDTIIVRLVRAFDASAIAERHFVATASCGICGKASLDEIAVRCDPIPAGAPLVDRAVILGLPATLREAQRVFEATGGLHAAGLFEPDGRLVAVREDVGRHNALDKLVGWAVLGGLMPLNDRRPAGQRPGEPRDRPEGGRRRASRSCAPCPRRRTWRSRPPSASARP